MLEENVFKPYDQELDQEQWPQLQLVDAVVYKYVPDGPDELCDLLESPFTQSLRITGTIKEIPAKFQYIVKDIPYAARERGSGITARTASSAGDEITITITDAGIYSLQSFKESGINSTIWALGSAAWYAISPAAEYSKYFDRSIEKAHAWDTILEFGESKHFSQVTVKQLFERYMEKHPSSGDLDHTKSVFITHRKFLICKIWQNFCLWKWLTENYTGIVNEVEKCVAARDTITTCSCDSLDQRPFSPDTTSGFDTLESLALEQKLGPRQLTSAWLTLSIMQKSGANAEITPLCLQRLATKLCKLMESSRQVNWVRCSVYQELILYMAVQVPAPPPGEVLSGSSDSSSRKALPAITNNQNPWEACPADMVDGVNNLEQENDPRSSPVLANH
ncbi:hypothetical protein HOY80DRAFT_861314, partial [Tuber brumale]